MTKFFATVALLLAGCNTLGGKLPLCNEPKYDPVVARNCSHCYDRPPYLSFNRNSRLPNPAGRAYLQQASELILKSNLPIKIVGFADSEEHNPLHLSKIRAEAVKQILLDYGVASKRINLSWHGDSRPLEVAPNCQLRTGEARRDRNQRAEIEMTESR